MGTFNLRLCGFQYPVKYLGSVLEPLWTTAFATIDSVIPTGGTSMLLPYNILLRMQWATIQVNGQKH
jgi:hypothetical protein